MSLKNKKKPSLQQKKFTKKITITFEPKKKFLNKKPSKYKWRRFICLPPKYKFLVLADSVSTLSHVLGSYVIIKTQKCLENILWKCIEIFKKMLIDFSSNRCVKVNFFQKSHSTVISTTFEFPAKKYTPDYLKMVCFKPSQVQNNWFFAFWNVQNFKFSQI